MPNFISIFFIIIHFWVSNLVNYKFYHNEINLFITIGIPYALFILFVLFTIILDKYRDDDNQIRIVLNYLSMSQLFFFALTWFIAFFVY